MKKTILLLVRYAGFAGVAVLICSAPSILHASGTISEALTTANVQGINDQTDVTATVQANVANTLATRTLTVNSSPSASTTTTIGSCVITYSTTVATSTNCTGNTAIINLVTATTSAVIAADIRSLTNVVDNVNGHGALTITGSGTTAIFTTSAAAETSSSVINFTDGTTGAVTSSASTAGVIPKKQQNTVTIGGTVDVGDTFSIGYSTGTTTYTTAASDASLANIASDIASTIQASSTYSGQAFTVSASSNVVTFLAKTAGTPFNFYYATTTNATPVAQVVTFTVPDVDGSADYTITLNGTSYAYDDTSADVATILSGLASAVSGNSAANCAVSGSSLICTSKTAGTAFTYSESASGGSGDYGSGGSSGGGGGGGGGGSSYTSPTNTSSNTTTNTTTNTAPVTSPTSYPTGISEKITKTLRYGQENNSVKILQTLLAADPSLGFNSKVTGYFGLKTKAAVEAFQVKYHIALPGQSGYGQVGPKTRAMLVEVFG